MLHRRYGFAVGWVLGLAVCLPGGLPCVALAAQANSVAGLAPAHRPANAPLAAHNEASPKDSGRYLFGVVQPIPGNLESIAATGRWFVPLRSPGMHAPYDLRGWHAQTVAPAKGVTGSADQ